MQSEHLHTSVVKNINFLIHIDTEIYETVLIIDSFKTLSL